MKTRQFLLVVFSMLLFTSQAQIEEQIDALMADYTDQPGAAIAIYQGEEILFQKGYGIANLDYDIPISPQTVFDIGSVSKQFTAACIILLAQDGKLTLDDPIQKHIPEYPVYEAGEITIRHLLHHTSGIRDYLSLMYLAGIPFDNVFTEEDGLEVLLRQQALNFPPGDEHLYSNSGYLLLAIIIRRASGMSIGDYAMKHIFEPLGMANTFIYEDGGVVVKNRAIGYGGGDGVFRREHHVDFAVGGDGQVYTTAEDMLHWNRNFDDPQVGGQAFLDTLLTAGVLNSGEELDYALGIVNGDYNGHPTVGHGGAWGGFRANFVRFPEQGFAIAIMSNYGRFRTDLMTYQIADLLLEDSAGSATTSASEEMEKATPATITLSKEELEAFCGEYWQADQAYSRRIYLRDDTLRYFRQLFNESPLVPISSNEFKMLEVTVDLRVTFEQEATAKRMIVRIDGGAPIVSEAYDKASYAAAELEPFTGTYYSPELDVSYDVISKDGSLHIPVKGMGELPLSPIMADHFTSDAVGVIEFERNEGGDLVGLKLHAGRVRDLMFVRQ